MLAWAVFSPLCGFLITGLFGTRLGDRASQLITCGFMLLSVAVACLAAFQVIHLGHEQVIPLFTFLDVGDLQLSWDIRFDALSSVMLLVVTIVSFCVHIYSIGYMAKDPSIPRFMSYLSLFTFMMLMLVTAENLIQLFLGWEGVGLTSYLLIGFWYSKDSANAAAIKAFLMNRVADLWFMVGLASIYFTFQTFDIPTILSAIPNLKGNTFTLFGTQVPILELSAILLFIGAMGKSAQIGLHTWLPDAMEGPTPVSALIHAATMVTAGVFLIVRMSPLYEAAPVAREIVAFIGGTTAFFAGTIAITQFDIKRVIAYSTCSQLGYMFFAAGVSAYSVAIFHLSTHAAFKALLFLGSGSVIHAMSDEQDMRKMGGLWKLIPSTYVLMWIGCLALGGIPFFAGYYSKELILSSAFLDHTWTGRYALWMGEAAVFLTAFYSWRLLWMTFHGPSKASEKILAHVHESPLVMLIPMGILAIGATFDGYIGDHFGWFVQKAQQFWQGSISIPLTAEEYAKVPHSLGYLGVSLGLIGVVMAILFYTRLSSWPGRLSAAFRPIYLFLYNKWYFDELYNYVFVRGGNLFATGLWRKGDQTIIDGYGPNGAANLSNRIASRISQLQSGYLYHYVFGMAVGVTLMGIWFILIMGG